MIHKQMVRLRQLEQQIDQIANQELEQLRRCAGKSRVQAISDQISLMQILRTRWGNSSPPHVSAALDRRLKMFQQLLSVEKIVPTPQTSGPDSQAE